MLADLLIILVRHLSAASALLVVVNKRVPQLSTKLGPLLGLLERLLLVGDPFLPVAVNKPVRKSISELGYPRPNLLPHRSPFTSTHFGRAASNLMLTVALKLKHGDRIPDELRPENHSPLGSKFGRG